MLQGLKLCLFISIIESKEAARVIKMQRMITRTTIALKNLQLISDLHDRTNKVRFCKFPKKSFRAGDFAYKDSLSKTDDHLPARY